MEFFRHLLSDLMDTGPVQAAEEVIAQLSMLLEKANFEKLSEEQVVAAVKTANTHGMRIHLDPGRVVDLDVWIRGHGLGTTRRRTWRSPVKGAMVEVPTIRRLALVTRLVEDPHIHVKLFKEIPLRDMEALLPNARVRMGPKDMAMLVGGGDGAVLTLVTKLVAVGLAAATQLIWVMALPLAGLSWKTFSGYRRAMKDRTAQMTRNLYFLNLGNNAAAIHMLATMVAQEELKEALLLYAFCAGESEDNRPGDLHELDVRVQTYLKARLGVVVDFDMGDAVETMDRLGLWSDREDLRVIPPAAAVQLLETHWRQRRSVGYYDDSGAALDRIEEAQRSASLEGSPGV